MFIGAVVGLFVGAIAMEVGSGLVGVAWDRPPDVLGPAALGQRQWASVGSYYGIAGGAIVGLTIGMVRRQRWQDRIVTPEGLDTRAPDPSPRPVVGEGPRGRGPVIGLIAIAVLCFTLAVAATSYALGVRNGGDDVVTSAQATTTSPSTTTTSTSTTTTTRPRRGFGVENRTDAQWGLLFAFNVSDFECTGSDFSIGARGRLTNRTDASRAAWVTVDILHETEDVRLDRLTTFVEGVGPSETVQFEVDRFQEEALTFRCQMVGLSSTPYTG
jgi:hypothetical protein